MFTLIRDFMDFMKIRKRRKIAVKKFMIHQQVTKFYEDLQESTGKADVPSFVYANQVIKNFIKTDKDVNKFYRKMELAGLV